MINTAPKTIQKHPTLLHTQDLKNLCKPLEHLGITVFSHLKVFNNNQLTVLCNHPESLVNYVRKKYYEADPCVNIHPEKVDIGEYLVWDAVNCLGKTKDMIQDSTNLNFRHVFTIIKKEINFTNFYHFGTNIPNSAINQLYINNLDLLDRFITYFNSQITLSKTLLQAYAIPINSEQKTPFDLWDNDEHLACNFQEKRKLFLDSMSIESEPKLTLKEKNCAKLLIQGKTAKEIAIEFGLSYRTIEDRISSLKHKFHAKNKADLIVKFLEMMAIEPY